MPTLNIILLLVGMLRGGKVFLKNLIPDLHVSSIYDIDIESLKLRGIKGIITDLDNTLVAWNCPGATPELAEWIKKLKQNGFAVTIVSNNNQKRVAEFSRPLGIPFIYAAKKPMSRAFFESVKRMGVKIEETVVIGDQLFTDILGGNRAGFYTILVVPVANTDGFWTRFNRRMERLVLSILRKKGMIPWEDQVNGS